MSNAIQWLSGKALIRKRGKKYGQNDYKVEMGFKAVIVEYSDYQCLT